MSVVLIIACSLVIVALLALLVVLRLRDRAARKVELPRVAIQLGRLGRRAAPTPRAPSLPSVPLTLGGDGPAPRRPRRMPDSTRPPPNEVRTVAQQPIAADEPSASGDAARKDRRYLN